MPVEGVEILVTAAQRDPGAAALDHGGNAHQPAALNPLPEAPGGLGWYPAADPGDLQQLCPALRGSGIGQALRQIGVPAREADDRLLHQPGRLVEVELLHIVRTGGIQLGDAPVQIGDGRLQPLLHQPAVVQAEVARIVAVFSIAAGLDNILHRQELPGHQRPPLIGQSAPLPVGIDLFGQLFLLPAEGLIFLPGPVLDRVQLLQQPAAVDLRQPHAAPHLARVTAHNQLVLADVHRHVVQHMAHRHGPAQHGGQRLSLFV